MKNNLADQNPKLAKEWHLTKNKDKSPNDFTYGVGLKVWWKCKQKHEWEAIISNRTRRGDGLISINKKNKLILF